MNNLKTNMQLSPEELVMNTSNASVRDFETILNYMALYAVDSKLPPEQITETVIDLAAKLEKYWKKFDSEISVDLLFRKIRDVRNAVIQQPIAPYSPAKTLMPDQLVDILRNRIADHAYELVGGRKQLKDEPELLIGYAWAGIAFEGQFRKDGTSYYSHTRYVADRSPRKINGVMHDVVEDNVIGIMPKHFIACHFQPRTIETNKAITRQIWCESASEELVQKFKVAGHEIKLGCTIKEPYGHYGARISDNQDAAETKDPDFDHNLMNDTEKHRIRHLIEKAFQLAVREKYIKPHSSKKTFIEKFVESTKMDERMPAGKLQETIDAIRETDFTKRREVLKKECADYGDYAATVVKYCSPKGEVLTFSRRAITMAYTLTSFIF